MKANELRIGNLVMLHNPKYRLIESDKIHIVLEVRENAAMVTIPGSGNEYGQYYEFLKPILISEEILLKCGFVLMNKWFDYELSLFRIGYITNDEYFQFESNGKVIDIKSLHQLQNIVYFNTDQELDVSKLF